MRVGWTKAERALFSKMGKLGAAARNKKLTPERRREIAQIAHRARVEREARERDDQ